MTTGLAARMYELFVGIDIAATTAEVATQRPGAKASRSFQIGVPGAAGLKCAVSVLAKK